MYYYNDIFYNDLEELIDDLNIDINDISDDFYLNYYECVLEPIVNINNDMLTNLVADYSEDRFSEDGYDDEYTPIEKALSNIDYDLVNSLIPKLWYPTKSCKLTKIDIIKHYE